MIRATLAKLFILVILAFIICLPEFFTLYRVNFLCLPYRPCERGNQATGENGKTAASEIRRKPKCDSSQTPEWQKWEEVCRQENQTTLTNPVTDRRSDQVSNKNWFMCETDMDMAELYPNLSSSALNISFEVFVELQLRDTELNLTLYGLGDHSSLRFYPPEEEDGAVDKKMKDDDGQRKAFYCCLPTSDPARKSQCLLRLANQTFLTAAAAAAATTTKQPPLKLTQKDEWHYVLRVLWLVLLCVVLLAVISAVFEQIFFYKKPKVHLLGCKVTNQQSRDGTKPRDIIIPKVGMKLHCDRTQSWAELSPIQEVESQDEVETLLHGAVEQCNAAHLHHRCHHTTEEQTL